MCRLIEIRDSIRFLDIMESANRASEHPLTPPGKGRDRRGTNKWRRVWGGFTNHPAGKISDSRASLPGFCVGLSLAGSATATAGLTLCFSLLTWKAREEEEMLHECEAARAAAVGTVEHVLPLSHLRA